MEFNSQVGQDKWVCEMLGYKQGGFFVDIGAHDGLYLSNTYALEKDLNWSGICVEADPNKYLSLIQNREAVCVNKAVYSFTGQVQFATGQDIYGVGQRLQVPIEEQKGWVGCITVHVLFENNVVPSVIDYISIDVEGADYDVLMGFPFAKYEVKLWTIEHNAYLDNGLLRDKIRAEMARKGYKLYEGDLKSDWADIFEDWFVNPKFIQ